MGVIFKIFPNLRQNGANLSNYHPEMSKFSSWNGTIFFRKFNIFYSKFWRCGMWMDPFFLKIGIFVGATLKFPAARPYPNQSWVTPTPGVNKWVERTCKQTNTYWKCFSFYLNEDFSQSFKIALCSNYSHILHNANLRSFANARDYNIVPDQSWDWIWEH